MRIPIVFAALALCACATTTPTNLQPSAYANQTIKDEQGILTAENSYKAWRLVVETGVKGGLIKGTLAGKVAALDNKIYSALQTLEAAYESGNADSVKAAAAQFNNALVLGLNTVRSN